MKLQVLLVEDSQDDMAQYKRDLPDIFKEHGCEVDIDPKDTFESGLKAARNPLTRYDLVITDTYRGNHQERDIAMVSELIKDFRQGKFCPLIVMSSGVRPEEFNETPFVRWAGKETASNLESQIQYMLRTGIPQSARKLHDELDNAAGKFLWGFIDENWDALESSAEKDVNLIERIVRRRAAMLLSDLIPSKYASHDSRYGLEYYIYPALDHRHYSLGDILVDKRTTRDFRVILTPHCHLFLQQGQERPKAEHFLTVKTVPITDVLRKKIKNAKQGTEERQENKLKLWARSPAHTERKPEGRHWYLPKFLDIPHLYCDFLQIESLPFESIKNDYRKVATLLPPYAEALQECFTSFYGSVGIPDIQTRSIMDLFDDT